MNALQVEIIPPDRWWRRPRYRLLKPLTLAGITVPAGFVSDGATTPRLLWPLFPPVDRYTPAAFLHDYLLEKGENRAAADHLFRAALAQLRIRHWRRVLMYLAVRARAWTTRL